jgi:N-acetylglutamate synthase-like GNAT family acetyltransferase
MTDTDLVEFRWAELSDSNAITRLINKAFLVEREFIDGDRTSFDVVCELLTKGQFLLAEEAEVLIGCVYIEQRGDGAYLGLLSIEPTRQGTGLGTRVTLRAEDFARDAGATRIDLKVVSGRSRLPEFYARLGYSRTGTEPFPADVPTKVPCHFINMSKQL